MVAHLKNFSSIIIVVLSVCMCVHVTQDTDPLALVDSGQLGQVGKAPDQCAGTCEPSRGRPNAEVGRPRYLIPNVGSNRKTVSFRDYGTIKGVRGRV